MFTGIIEAVGVVADVEHRGKGRCFRIQAPFAGELRVDQSVSVDGVCQTVVHVEDGSFDVVAIEETMSKTSLGEYEAGRRVNLERAMPANGRLDGHFVQGHVDATGVVENIEVHENSHLFTIAFEAEFAHLIVPVGSIAVDGVSLTVARLGEKDFSVAIIPYTYEHTVVKDWAPGRRVNLEFDLVGKYVTRWLALRKDKS